MGTVETRVVITGIGLVTGLGPDRESTWKSLLGGKGAVRRLDSDDFALPAEFCGARFGAGNFLGAPAESCDALGGEIFLEEPNIRLALRAAKDAVTDAGVDWDAAQSVRRGCVLGTSKGGMKSIARALAGLSSKSNPPPELWPMFWPSTPAALVAERWKIRGPVLCPVAACATGLMSLWRAAQLIQEGTCDLVLAGSTDASLEPAVLGAFSRMGVLAKIDPGDPSASCRPFDRDRSGFVVGEGAAVLVMERAEHALGRGARPYGEWLAGGAVSDPSGIARLDPEACSLIWLIQDVMRRGDIDPGVLDYINLHGTGTWENDRAETRALRTVLGPHADAVSCSSLKGALGHLLGAAGSVETALTLLAMRDSTIPPTRNLRRPDPECDLDYTPRHSRPRTIRQALKLSLGFGGHQVAAVFRAFRG